jgi:hypothetical protein
VEKDICVMCYSQSNISRGVGVSFFEKGKRNCRVVRVARLGAFPRQLSNDDDPER